MTEQDQRHGPPSSAMGVVRSRLIAKIDEMISQIAISETTPPYSHLQIEANLVSPHVTAAPSRRFILDTINVDELRHHVTDNDGDVWPVSQNSNFPNGLPSPMDSNYAGTPPTTRDQILAVSGSTPYPATVSSHSSALNGNFVATDIQEHIQEAQDTPSLTMLSASSDLSTEGPEGISRRLSKRQRSSAVNPPKLEQSPIDKQIEGIWEQIHNPRSLATGNDLRETMSFVLDKISGDANRLKPTNLDFGEATKYCRQITTSTRTARAFEVIVQAHWVDCYDARLTALLEEQPSLRHPERKKMVINEACASFAWSDKELRNRMAIWRGYQEIKNAAGWSALIFAGPAYTDSANIDYVSTKKR